MLQRRGVLPIADAVDLLLDACEPVAQAHAVGIVHGDLRPAKLVCVRRRDGGDAIRVLGFGRSPPGPRAAVDERGVWRGSLLESPFYMSPEQLEASPVVDARADVWALGVMLYELVTGALPFAGDTLPELAVKIAARRPLPLRDRRPDAPDGLAAVIARCLEKDRERRFGSAADLAVALLPFCSQRGRTSIERIARSASSAHWSWAPASSTIPDAPPPSTRPSTRAAAWESALDSPEPNGPASIGSAERSPAIPLGEASTPFAAAVEERTTASEAAVVGVKPLRSEDAEPARPEADSDEAAARRSARSQAMGGVLFALATLGIAAVTGFAILASRPPPPAPVTADGRVGEKPSAASPGREPARSAESHLAEPLSTGKPAMSSPPSPPPDRASAAHASAPSVPPSASPAPPRARGASTEPPAASAAAAAARRKAGCDPGVYLDEQGRTHFKPECVAAAEPPLGAPARSRGARPECDPSYTLDAQGRVHFKPECFVDRQGDRRR
ncbi:MAG: protein kinase [Myxococcales bacterium]|nr:protein kinase [Myxococcales bacterium]